MAFGSRTVAQRDVEFNVNLGQFRAQLGEAANVYDRTTGQMSDQALRLSVSQEKVNRAIKRHGAESLAARQATLGLRNEMASLAREQNAVGVSAERSSRALLTEERALGRFSRGALAAAGISSELKRALLLGSGSFIVGIGVAAIFKESITAAKNEEVALGQLDVALANTGNARLVYKRRIEEALAAQVKSTAFTNTELTTSLSVFIRRFGDVNKALRANAIAADVARAKNISLADAQTLILRASFGNPRSLRILGIELTKTTTNMDALKASTKHASAEQVAAAKAADLQANELSALDQVNAKYHGNAAKFLTTTAGKQALFNSELERSKEIIGAALLPEFNRMLTRLSEWLDKMNRTGKLQRDVNHILHDAGQAFHVAGDGAHYMKDIVEHLAPIFGGLKNEVKLLMLALVLFKLRGVTAFKTGAAEIEASAAASTTALNIEAAAAARASGIIGTVIGGFGLNRGGGLSPKTTGFARFVAPYAFAAVAGQGYGAVKKLGGKLDVTVSQIPGGSGDSFIEYTDPVDGKQRFVGPVKAGTNVAGAIEKELERLHPGYGKKGTTGGQTSANQAVSEHVSQQNRPRGGAGGTKPPRKPPGLVLGLTEAQQTDLYRAEGTKGTADDLKALNKQLGILNRLVQQHGLNPAQLNSLLQQRDSVLSQIDSITASSASKGDSARRKAQAAADRAFRHQESQLKTALQQAKNSGNTARTTKALKELEAFYTREARDPKLSQAVRDAARASNVALHKQADTIAGVLRHRESVLKLAVEKAKLTDGTLDDIAAVKKLEAFYKREANDPKLARALRDAFAAKDVAAKLVLKKLGVGEKSAFGKLEQEFLDAFTNIQASFGSNVKPHVVVHQHFPHPPTGNGQRESTIAKIAARSAWDQ